MGYPLLIVAGKGGVVMDFACLRIDVWGTDFLVYGCLFVVRVYRVLMFVSVRVYSVYGFLIYGLFSIRFIQYMVLCGWFVDSIDD